MSHLYSKRLLSSFLLCGLLVFGWQAFGSSATDADTELEHRPSTSSPIVDSVQLDPAIAVQNDLNHTEDDEWDFAIVWDGVSRSGGDFGNV